MMFCTFELCNEQRLHTLSIQSYKNVTIVIYNYSNVVLTRNLKSD